MKLSSRYDKSKNPEQKEYTFLTLAECKQLTGHALALGNDGRVANVKITSTKTWKTRADVEIGWKFGLYEYGKELVTKDSDNQFFVKENELSEQAEQDTDPVYCPICDSGDAAYMGALGNRQHFRCNNCGMDFSHLANS